jgi:four helix bundle protein
VKEMLKFKKWNIYILSRDLTVHTYILINTFPPEEKYALCAQIRRSLISVSSNFVEGISRFSKKDKIHFLNMSYSSLMEVACQIDTANGLGYVTDDELKEFEKMVNTLGIKISNFINSLKKE